jgi:RNA polymerase sigma factor (sigma-70 family)
MMMSRGSSATLAAPSVTAAKERSDRDLVRDARNGDDAAFGCLYDRYRRRIASYAYGMVKDHARAEDITQDVFISALRRMRETDRPIAFKPWIYEIARNACIDHFRRGKRAEELSFDADDGHFAADQWLVAQSPQPDAAMDTKQQLDDLCGAFGGLSETHHQILLLRELEGLSYREIGERMGLSRPAVESTLFRARRRLNEEYDDLVSGRRCTRIQSIIAAASEGMLGSRDRRRMMRHLSHCPSCRSHARTMGVREPAPRPRVAQRLKALLPLPAFLRRGNGRDGAVQNVGGPDTAGTVARLTASVGPQLEPLAASWTKAAVAAVTIAAAGVGTGIATTPRSAHTLFPWSAPAAKTHTHSRAVPAAGHVRAVQRVYAHAPAVGASRTAATLPSNERSGGAGARGSAPLTDRTGAGAALLLPTVDLASTVAAPVRPPSLPSAKLPTPPPHTTAPPLLHQVVAVTRAAPDPAAVTRVATGGSTEPSPSSQPAPAPEQPAPHHHTHG